MGSRQASGQFGMQTHGQNLHSFGENVAFVQKAIDATTVYRAFTYAGSDNRAGKVQFVPAGVGVTLPHDG